MRQLDWNDDSAVSMKEVFQAFFSVKTRQTITGSRQCLIFFWKDSGTDIKIECQTQISHSKAKTT